MFDEIFVFITSAKIQDIRLLANRRKAYSDAMPLGHSLLTSKSRPCSLTDKSRSERQPSIAANKVSTSVDKSSPCGIGKMHVISSFKKLPLNKTGCKSWRSKK